MGLWKIARVKQVAFYGRNGGDSLTRKLMPEYDFMKEISLLCRLGLSPLPLPPSWYAVPLRLILGLGFIEHGYAKLARGPDEFIAILHAIGTPFADLLGWATIVVEIGGGIDDPPRRLCARGHGAYDRCAAGSHLHRSCLEWIQLDQAVVLRCNGCSLWATGLRDRPALQAKPQWRQRTQGQQRLYARVRVLIPPGTLIPRYLRKHTEVGSLLLVPFARRTAFELQQAEAARDAARHQFAQVFLPGTLVRQTITHESHEAVNFVWPQFQGRREQWVQSSQDWRHRSDRQRQVVVQPGGDWIVIP